MRVIYAAFLQVLIAILFTASHAHIINKDEVQGYVMIVQTKEFGWIGSWLQITALRPGLTPNLFQPPFQYTRSIYETDML